ncbi:MAG: response regulator [Terriglobia bacterium]
MLRTVLVADDNLTVQRMASEMLSEEGMEVITVANGMAAIKKLPEVKPLVVVADVDMPGKNGYEVCDFVKSQPELGYVRVLLLVSDTDPLDGDRGAEVRADGIVKKPFDRQEFISIVAKSMGEAQAMCPPPAAVEAAGPTEAAESAEPVEPVGASELNGPDGLAGPHGPVEVAPPPADHPAFETTVECAAPPEAPDELAAFSNIMPDEFAAASLESSEPPIVDWPAGPWVADELSGLAATGSEPAFIESSLQDFAAPQAVVTAVAEVAAPEPAPLPDHTQPDIPEAYFFAEQQIPEAAPSDLTPGAAPLAGSPEGGLGAAAPAIDASLVSAIIHAVVARMAPPALPREAVQGLERRLVDEVMAEIAAKL